MVFESHPNETFILGASTWRIEDITHDRVLVAPAPGEPGKMPFWKGDGPGRPLEFGRRIGALVRELRALPKPAALTRLVTEHDLDPGAAENLLQFLADQEAATGQVPDDRTIVIERGRGRTGRLARLRSHPLRQPHPHSLGHGGQRAHPCRRRARGRNALGRRRLRSAFSRYRRAARSRLVPRRVGRSHAPGSAPAWFDGTFAGRFREAAGRALLLPRRRADQRSPLWQLRKRSYDLLSVASRYPSFPLLLEAYRECLRDVFDMPALIETLRAIEQRQLRVHVVETRKPSPFASSLLFSYVANFLYDGDAPLAERRAQALTIDQDQLRELLGEADLRELLDADAIAEVEETAQCLAEKYRARYCRWHSRSLLAPRRSLARRTGAAASSIRRCWNRLTGLCVRAACSNCASPVSAASSPPRMRRAIAMRWAFRFRPACPLPCSSRWRIRSLNWFAAMPAPMARLRCAKSAERFALDAAVVENTLRQLAIEGRVLEGGFRPGGLHREWCDAEILRQIRRKSLAKLRREVEPVEQHTLARFLTHWQGLLTPRRSAHAHLDALLDAIESLQGAPLPASLLETAILPARVADTSRLAWIR